MSVAKYYPFSGAKGRLRLGLKPISLPEWIQYEDDFSERVHQKKSLIKNQRLRVLNFLPESIEAQNELLQQLLKYLSGFQSHLFNVEKDKITSLKENITYTLSDYKDCPIELVSYLVVDDFCLLESNDEDFRLVAASVCAPTWWELSEKMGKPLTSVHSPIANLEETIGRMIRHFLKNLSFEDCYQRSNWFLFTRPDFCVFPDSFNMYEDLIDTNLENIEDLLYLRTERQTFRKLKNTKNIAFGIKVYTAPISIVKEHTAIAEDLLIALETMTAEQKQALGISFVEEPLRRYLEKVAA